MPSATDALLQNVQSALNLVQRELTQNLTPIRQALAAYEQAVEEDFVAVYCREHSLRCPKLQGKSPDDAAEDLRKAVSLLPEFGGIALNQPSEESLEQGTPSSQQTTDAAIVPSSPSHPIASEDPVTLQFRLKFPELSNAAEHGSLLIFGIFAGRTKSLPGPLGLASDWVDTTGEGNRAVANAVRRMRQGHVFAVIICDQAIAHQHAEPVVNAARAHKIPIGYAGKGGNASLARALQTIEEKLHQ